MPRPKILILLLLALALPIMANGLSHFVEGTAIGVVARSPTQSNPPIFVNTATGDGVSTFPEGQWSEVDISSLVPAGTKAVFLSGILTITHGTTPEICDLSVSYRNSDETHNYGSLGLVIEPHLGGGQRSTHATWVPITNGSFDFKWTANTAKLGTYPMHCSYGINLSLVAYMR